MRSFASLRTTDHEWAWGLEALRRMWMRRVRHESALSGRTLVARKTLELAGRPVERLFHGIAAEVAHRHLGHQRLNIDLLANPVRRRGAGDRQDLVIVDIRIVVERALGRALLRPGLERRELLERGQIVAAARRDHLLGSRRRGKVDD